MNDYGLDIILNIFYQPTDELKQLIEENFNRNEHPFIPINGGASLKNDHWCKEYLRFDDVGDNISNLNPILNEMTSIYWYWKNAIKDNCTHIGFNHYRRFFKDSEIQDYNDYDIIVSKPIWSSDKITLAYQYKYYHVLSDLQTCIDIIRNDFDYEWGECFRKYLLSSGQNLAPCNMFIMKKELFNEWCSFVFPILFKLKDIICSTEEFKFRDNYQKRALCFLTERMFNYWYFLKKLSGLKTKEVDIVEKLEYKPSGINERGDFSKQFPKVALVAIAKDEDEYLKEWVDYHLKIGFDEIFVYQNNWRYTRSDINDNRVHLEVLDGHRMQMKCYNDFILNHTNGYDFVAFFDVDEFLYIRENKNVAEVLYDYRNIDSIFVNWRLFGDNGISEVSNGDYSVIRRFTKCDKKLHRLGKHILNIKRLRTTVIFNNPHILQYNSEPLKEFRSVDSNLRQYCVGGNIVDNQEIERMELYHFRNKSWNEMIKRRFGTDDAFHEADNCDFRRDMIAVKREFENHNKNEVYNINLLKRMFGKKKSLLCCIAKNEDNYINEWIDYHLKLGFDEIVIFQNNWRANINKNFLDRVILIPYDNNDKFAQQQAYNICISLFGDCFEWIAFFDVDEFLVLKIDSNVNEWLSNYSMYNAIGVNWRYFGNCNQDYVINNNYTITRFTTCQSLLDQHIKTILHTGVTTDTMHICCHCTNTSFNKNTTIAVDGITFINGWSNTSNLESCVSIAYLAHFRCKSTQEWNDKCIKNNSGIQHEMLEYTVKKDVCFQECNKNEVIDLSIKDFLLCK